MSPANLGQAAGNGESPLRAVWNTTIRTLPYQAHELDPERSVCERRTATAKLHRL